MDDLSRRFLAMLPQQRYVAVAVARHVEEACGVTAMQAATLTAISDGARRTSDVAESTHQHASGASRVIDTLVQSGHVDRQTDPSDRRAVVLSLTPSGKDLDDRIRQAYGEVLVAILDAMGHDDAARYVDLAQAFLDAAEQAVGPL